MTLGWQAATVHFNYNGEWSALFQIGDRWPLPPQLAGEAYVHRNSAGYDGVFYHMVAHDPWLARGFSSYTDNASLRWRRILTPALAHTIVAGVDAHIHFAYILVNLFFVFLGTLWLARYSNVLGLPSISGVAFLAVPSVLVSMDRLTVDTALAAFAVGFIFYHSQNRSWAATIVLALSPLARETGLALAAGQAWFSLRDRNWRLIFLTLISILPFVAWSTFVFFHTYADGTRWLGLPFFGIVLRSLHPLQYPVTGRWVAAAAAFDYLALIGVWIAIILAFRLAIRRSLDITSLCIYSFTLGALCLQKADIWAGAYEFGRTMSPLLILLGLTAMRERKFCFLLPLVFNLPRILLQLEPQIRGILRH